MPVEAVLEALVTDAEAGLTQTEAASRLRSVGPNELDEQRVTPEWLKFLRQFANTMIIVLLLAAVITIFIGDIADTIVILTVVVMNAAIGYAQEHRAARAMSLLRRLSAPFANVVRDGKVRSIPARELVPGDILRLEAGDVVAADARLIDAPNLRVNESVLTGESVPIDKTVDCPLAGDLLLADQTDMVFKGTAAVYGHAVGVVTTTGMDTALGNVATLLQTHAPPATPLQRRLARLARDISLVAIALCAVVYILGVATGESPTRMLLTAVSLAVAAIPESLPAVVTISLALGSQRMAQHHAIVRALPAVETLGSVTVIASDKTGTLTQGVMVVERVWCGVDREWMVTGDGFAPEGCVTSCHDDDDDADDALVHRLARAAVLCNDATLVAPRTTDDAWTVAGDPTEGALLAFASKLGMRASRLRGQLARLAEIPFDSSRRRMTTIHALASGRVLAITKGAYEAVSPTVGETVRDAARQAQVYARAGYRVLAFAGKEYDTLDEALRTDANNEFYGLVALADPPRPEAAAAVTQARDAGVATVMITGDHPATARAVADRVGLGPEGVVMTGVELASLGDKLVDRVEHVSVYARTSSEQKLDIVDAWKQRGAIVAMTGDGVNDAAALRLADIGVAMGVNGTEVAKDAADMVLADDNFATIVEAIHEGRRIYDNIRRFVQYGLTGGVAEIAVMVAAPLVGLPLALLPAQILWINLLTHGLPGLALGVEQAEPGSMTRPPRRPDENVFARGLAQRIVGAGFLTAAVAIGLALWESSHHGPWQTMLFTSLAFMQLGAAFAVRSEIASSFSLGLTSNRSLLYAVVAMVAAQVCAIYIPALQQLLGTQGLGFIDFASVVAASSVTFLAIEAEKLYRRHRSTPETSVATVASACVDEER